MKATNLDDAGAVILLETLAEANEAMVKIATAMRAKPGQREVVRGGDVRKYLSEPVVEAYVEVETVSGDAFCWWFEINRVGDEWRIEGSLRRTNGDGQDALRNFPSQPARTVTQLRDEARNTLAALVSSAESFTLKAPSA